jgi:hypothetical protein
MVFAIPEQGARLGSAPENDIVLRVPGVSRWHALLNPSPAGIEVVDTGSKNGLLVERQRVKRAILTPGLRLQVGAAWIEVEEVSASAEALAFLASSSSTGAVHQPPTTTVGPGRDPKGLSSADTALALAYHIAQAGAGLPGKRADLLARIKACLGAEAFAPFEITRRGRVRAVESAGEFPIGDTTILTSLAMGSRSSGRDQVVLKRSERFLLAEKDTWFLAARFRDASLAQEGWRKDFLRFLAHQFFVPVRNLEDLSSSEASRALVLARGNKRRTALLLGISPGTLYKLLSRRTTPKR